ncbi:unnamed protein product [Boreogadus saida]
MLCRSAHFLTSKEGKKRCVGRDRDCSSTACFDCHHHGNKNPNPVERQAPPSHTHHPVTADPQTSAEAVSLPSGKETGQERVAKRGVSQITSPVRAGLREGLGWDEDPMGITFEACEPSG